MVRHLGSFLLGAWLACLPALPLWGDEDAERKSVLALQRVMQKAIQDVEPAIACILVSRSDAYQRLGQKVSPEFPGKLGSFEAGSLDFLGDLKEEERETLRKKLDLGGPGTIPESFGSGVVLEPQGLILTNYHVVRDATKVFVRLAKGKGSYADIHAADPRSDLAVLRLLHPPVGLKPIPLGDADRCARGQFVLTIANPFAAGFRDGQPSASWGIISNIRRRAPGNPREEKRIKTLHHYGTLLQTDARLNLGCSGGALINLEGEMVGLTTALAAIHGGETPGGFAVPMDAGMRRIIEVLKRGEEVDYGFLGVGFDEGRPRFGEGVELTNVVPGSPADRDGRLLVKDRILAINDKTIRESDELFLALGTQLAGTRIRLLVQRGRGGVGPVQVTLAKFSVPGKRIASSLGKRPFFRGLRVDYTSCLLELPSQVLFPRIPPGVMISEVQAGSPASVSRLKVGDVITHLAGQAIKDPADFYQQALRQTGPVELALFGSGPTARVTLGR